MLERFLHYIKQQSLIGNQEKLILAVSGGVDSIVMAHLFHLSEIPFAIAHCNFKLRGKESDQDEYFVRELAEKYNVQFFCKSFDTRDYASNNKVSIQMAARELRYTWFSDLLNNSGFKAIATAHHSNDSLETFLINFTRGSGILGLKGISSIQGNIIRPLLFSNREEIENYAKINNLNFRSDSSNDSDKYVRNKIRHHIVPVLQEINPSILDTAKQTTEHFQDIEAILASFIELQSGKLIREEDGATYISINHLKDIAGRSTVLYEIIKNFNFNGHQVKDIIESIEKGESGKRFYSSTHNILKDREELIITKKEDGEDFVNPFSIQQNDFIIDTPVKLVISKHQPGSFELNKTDSNVALLDADLLNFPLIIRKWQKGDYFYPLGLNGKKKLSDFFIDKKLSLIEKENIWLLTSGDQIVWIIGQRIDNRFKISETTKVILKIETFL